MYFKFNLLQYENISQYKNIKIEYIVRIIMNLKVSEIAYKTLEHHAKGTGKTIAAISVALKFNEMAASQANKRDVQCAAIQLLLKRANKTYCNFYKVGLESEQLRLYLDNNEYCGIGLQWSLMRYMKIFLLNSNRVEDHIEVLTNCIKYNKYTAYSSCGSNYIHVMCFDTNNHILLYICIPHKITSDLQSNRKESTYQTCDHKTLEQEFGNSGIFWLMPSDGGRDRQIMSYYNSINRLKTTGYKFYKISVVKQDGKTYIHIFSDEKNTKIYILDMMIYIERYLLCNCGYDNKRGRDNIRALVDSINHNKCIVYDDEFDVIIIASDDDNDILVTFKINGS